MIPLGQKVRALRTARGMTQQRLAERSGVGQALVASLESGTRRYVTSPDIDLLARGLEISPDELWSQVPGGRQEARYIALMQVDAVETLDSA